MITIPDHKKAVYDRVDIQIDVNGTYFNQERKLKAGICIGLKIVPISDPSAVTSSVNTSVEDNRGTDIVTSTDFRDYITQSGYLDSYKPCHFTTDNKIKVIANATNPISGNAFKAQMVFLILQDK